MFRFMISFASRFMMSRAHKRGIFPKCGARLTENLIYVPYFEDAPTQGLYITVYLGCLGKLHKISVMMH
jgi:hypothetical protein